MTCTACGEGTAASSATTVSAVGESPRVIKVLYQCGSCSALQTAEKLETELTDDERAVWRQKRTTKIGRD